MGIQKISDLAGGGPVFAPGSIYFPLTDYMYDSAYTHAANVHTVFGIIQAVPFVTADMPYRSVFRTVHSGNTIGSLNIQPSDDGTIPNGGQFFGRNSAGGTMFNIEFSDVIVDNEKHWFFFAYDSNTANYICIIDGRPASISAATTNTGTQSSGSSAAFGLGSNDSGNPATDYEGEVSFFGYDDQYRTNWRDFFEDDGTPKDVDTTTWTEWGGTQPLAFNPNGDLRNNLGRIGNFVQSGANTRAGDMMNYAPSRGIATVGTASLRDVADGRTAWVDAQEIIGAGVPDPTDISGGGCMLLCDALRPGNTADQWDDLSGNGNHLVKDAGSTFPTISNGIASFNGTSDVLDLPLNMSGWSAGELFILHRRYIDNGDTGSNTGFLDLGTRGDSFQDHYTYGSQVYTGFGRDTRITIGNPSGLVDQWHVVNILSANNDWKFWFNAVLEYSTTSNTVSFPNGGHIGGAGTGGVWFQGEIKGIALFNRKLGALERAQVRGWLASL